MASGTSDENGQRAGEPRTKSGQPVGGGILRDKRRVEDKQAFGTLSVLIQRGDQPHRATGQKRHENRPDSAGAQEFQGKGRRLKRIVAPFGRCTLPLRAQDTQRGAHAIQHDLPAVHFQGQRGGSFDRNRAERAPGGEQDKIIEIESASGTRQSGEGFAGLA